MNPQIVGLSQSAQKNARTVFNNTQGAQPGTYLGVSPDALTSLQGLKPLSLPTVPRLPSTQKTVAPSVISSKPAQAAKSSLTAYVNGVNQARASNAQASALNAQNTAGKQFILTASGGKWVDAASPDFATNGATSGAITPSASAANPSTGNAAAAPNAPQNNPNAVLQGYLLSMDFSRVSQNDAATLGVDTTGLPKNADGTYNLSPFKDLLVKQNTSQGTQTTAQQTGLDPAKALNNNDVQAVLNKGEETWTNIMDAIINGTTAIPLNDSQKQLLQSTKDSFTIARREIERANQTHEGATSVINAATGRSEYTPQLAADRLAEVVDNGNRELQKFDIDSANALANLERSLRDDNMEALKGAWSNIKDIQDRKQQTIEKVYTETRRIAENMEKENNAKEKAFNDERAKVVEDALASGVPTAVITKASRAKNYDELIGSLNGYSIGGTGTVAEYNAYKNNVISTGGVPMSFNEYQTADANRKAHIARAGAAVTNYGLNGLSPLSKGQEQRLNSLMTHYNDKISTPMMKLDQAIATAMRLKNSPDKPFTQIATLYQMIKILDQDSAVRESETELIQRAQSAVSKIQNSWHKFTTGAFLSDETATAMVDEALAIAKDGKKAYSKLASSLQAQANTAGYGDHFTSFRDELKSVDAEFEKALQEASGSQKEQESELSAIAQSKPQLADGILKALRAGKKPEEVLRALKTSNLIE